MTNSSTDPPDIDSKNSSAIPKVHEGFARLAGRKSSPAATLRVKETQLKKPINPISHANASSNGLDGGAIDEKASRQAGAPGSVSSLSVNATHESQGPLVEKTKRGNSVKQNNTNNTTGNDNVIDEARANAEGTAPPLKGGRMQSFWAELRRTFWLVATYSYMNVLLVFVPVGLIVANVGHMDARLIFSLNAIAIVPLAGLLSHATESVASKMGDSLGALLNVTFGNAVELIIFIIALTKDELRIVQASLLGSILANLLLILGMGFFLGGLRFREQIYNSTVTQMSACLLSLSVISLVLPTAFHASFKDEVKADKQSLKISRGTSVILLLVYIIYLLFQLKSHAYMYESTPQHILDAEMTPGPAAAWLETSSSSDDSSSSSDSDSSARSRDTIGRRMKKVLRGNRRRKSSVASADTLELKAMRGSSLGKENSSPNEENGSEASSFRPHYFQRGSYNDSKDDDSTDDETLYRRYKRHRMRRRARKHQNKKGRRVEPAGATINERGESGAEAGENDTRRVDFALRGNNNAATGEQADAFVAASAAEEGDAGALDAGNESGTVTKRPFPALRALSVKNFAPTVFVQKPDQTAPLTTIQSGPVPRVRYGIRRTNSLPDRLGQQQRMLRPPGAMYPAQVPLVALNTAATATSPRGQDGAEDEHLTQTAAVLLLLGTTGLVAACAEFLVDSIREVTEKSTISEMFIGLIILPIVGNAAEHVTAVTVAMKNKVDLAIGVAVGSSIQIALFVTPLVVIIGWIIGKAMTLYFTLFETVCLFVSAFIVNFLVLDGRSNYLEGALLCAVYVIIAILAFYYPDNNDASDWSA